MKFIVLISLCTSEAAKQGLVFVRVHVCLVPSRSNWILVTFDLDLPPRMLFYAIRVLLPKIDDGEQDLCSGHAV